MNHTSLTLQAKILGLSVVGVGLLGITIASPLVVDQPSLDNIKIGKIFLSASGTATTSGNSNITLDGSNGSVELKGNLTMPGYGTRCTSNTGCILTTDADGIVQFATINISQRINHHTGTIATPQPNFFTRRGGNTAQVDTGASEIVFYDRTIIGNNANSDVSLRIGLSGAINSASQGNSKTVDVAGPIMSRTALSLESPIDVSKSADYPFSPNRTSAVIQKSTSSDTIEAMKLQVGHTSDDGASYDRSDFIIESLSNSIKARLGINTPTYPSKELDINGQTLSRGDLIVGSGSNPTLFANTSTKKVGINTTPSRATFDVNGSSKFNGSLSIQGTPEHIANTTNGMTSITLGEITSNETGNLRTLADVECKLLTVDSNGNLVLEQIPYNICHNITDPNAPINGACGSAHNTTGTSTPTSNLCTAGTTSSVAGSGPWTWSCAGSNGGTSASCQMNKEIETNTNDLCINIIGNQEEIPNNYNIGFNNYCMPSLNSGTITNTYFDRTNLYRAGMGVGDGNAGESCREYLSRIGNMPLNSNLKTIYIDENGNSQEHLGKCIYEKPSGTSLGWQNNCRIGNPDDRFGGWNPSVYCSDTYQILQGGSTLVGDPNRQKTYRMKEYAPFTQTQSKSWNTTSNILSLFNTNPNQPLSGSVGQHCMDFIRGIGHDVNENEVDVNSLLGNQGQGSCLYAKGVTTVSIENYQFLGTIYTFNTTECKVVSSYDPAPGDNFYPTNYCNGYDQRAYKYR